MTTKQIIIVQDEHLAHISLGSFLQDVGFETASDGELDMNILVPEISSGIDPEIGESTDG